MPWMDKSVNQQRQQFIALASCQGANISELARQFGISRKCAYKWLSRYDPQLGATSLLDHSRRPKSSPSRSSAELEQQVLAVRDTHPGWGARKIAHVLARDQGIELATSTANAILKRHARISEAASQAATPWQRFVHEQPNDLWQIDFKGDFEMHPSGHTSGRCHALTALDDHSRYNLILKALPCQTKPVVQSALIEAFERYGLPKRINADNGPPWGVSVRLPDRKPLTQLGVWLIRLGIELSHSRPHHPQTNGKDERFHRTLDRELLAHQMLTDLAHAQQAFDRYRPIYNEYRPHEALGMDVPKQHYRPSLRAYPGSLPPVEYDSADVVRKVDDNGWISFKNRYVRIGKALYGYPVALRPDPLKERTWLVFFCNSQVARFEESDLRSKEHKFVHIDAQ